MYRYRREMVQKAIFEQVKTFNIHIVIFSRAVVFIEPFFHVQFPSFDTLVM